MTPSKIRTTVICLTAIEIAEILDRLRWLSLQLAHQCYQALQENRAITISDVSQEIFVDTLEQLHKIAHFGDLDHITAYLRKVLCNAIMARTIRKFRHTFGSIEIDLEISVESREHEFDFIYDLERTLNTHEKKLVTLVVYEHAELVFSSWLWFTYGLDPDSLTLQERYSFGQEYYGGNLAGLIQEYADYSRYNV